MSDVNYSEQLRQNILSKRAEILPNTTAVNVALVKRSLSTDQRVAAEDELWRSKIGATRAEC